MQIKKVMLLLFGLLTSFSLNAGNLVVEVTDDKGNVIEDAVVYLVTDLPIPRTSPDDFEVEQKDKMFAPFVTIIPAGASVSFPNRDGIGHHVYSFSPARNFQLPLSELELTEKITFDNPGVVTLGCNIHDWMVAYIYVVEAQLFMKTGAEGSVIFSDLPDGQYEVHVAHPGMQSSGEFTSSVTINGDAAQNLAVSLGLKPQYFWKPEPRMHEEVY